LSDGIRLKASVRLNPFNGPRFSARTSVGLNRLASSEDWGRVSDDGRTATVTPGLGRLWILSVPDTELRKPAGSPVGASLTVMTEGWRAGLAADMSSWIADSAPWPTVVGKLRAAAAADATPPPETPASHTTDSDDLAETEGRPPLTPPVDWPIADPFGPSSGPGPTSEPRLSDSRPASRAGAASVASPSMTTLDHESEFGDPFA
jgi:hypothetical protein